MFLHLGLCSAKKFLSVQETSSGHLLTPAFVASWQPEWGEVSKMVIFINLSVLTRMSVRTGAGTVLGFSLSSILFSLESVHLPDLSFSRRSSFLILLWLSFCPLCLHANFKIFFLS